jgi:hypothetical protein
MSRNAPENKTPYILIEGMDNRGYIMGRLNITTNNGDGAVELMTGNTLYFTWGANKYRIGVSDGKLTATSVPI